MHIPAPLIERLRDARNVVVFTGAGISAESGIPTFRDAMTGLWERFDPAQLASPEAYRRDREFVWGWYEWRRMQVLRAQPNPAHRAIAEMAKHGPRLSVVTQNVDDLHERAGSVDVAHLHGSLFAPRCFDCHRGMEFSLAIPDEPEHGRRVPPPRCRHCGGWARPGVVWFGEALPESVMEFAFEQAACCDLLISIGTSGLVQPAATIPMLALRQGAAVVQVNPQQTAMDEYSSYSLRGSAASVLPALVAQAWGQAV